MPIKRVPGPAQKTLRATINALDNHVGKTGWFKSARYQPEPGETHAPLVADVARLQEFGGRANNVTIPPRPTLRPTIASKSALWVKTFQKLTKDSLRGTLNPKLILQGVVDLAAANWRTAITRLRTPKLSEATIARRKEKYLSKSKTTSKTLKSGIDKPLVETGYMLATLSGEVTRGNTRR